jgi:hypothetical protein
MTCDKRRFATQKEAEAFEANNRARNDYAPQRSYLCPECGSYHLTANAPGNVTGTNYTQTNLFKVTPADQRERIRQLRDEGKTVPEIARAVSMTEWAVYYHLKVLRGEQPTLTTPTTRPKKESAPLTIRSMTTLDQLDLEEQRLQQQLKKVRSENKAWRDLNEITVERHNGTRSVLIRKSGERMVVATTDLRELIDKLEAIWEELCQTN